MKILITTDWYAPTVNGVVASVTTLCRELRARGHAVRILTLSRSPRSYEQDGVTYLGSVPAGLVYPGARLRTAPAERLIRNLLDWKPDIVHSQCEFSTFPIARRIANALSIPLIHTWHTVYEDFTHYFSPSIKWGRRAVAAFARRIGARADCLIAPTEKAAAPLRSYGVRRPIRVIPSGIDLHRFETPVVNAELTRLRESLQIPADHFLLLSLGRLAEEKNLPELLLFLAGLKGQPVTLLLVGDGPYRPQLEQQVRALQLEDQVRFTGMVPPEQTPAYYQLADLFVCASTSETQGLTYAEALASGLPVLCRADPCIAGVISNGINGWQYRDEHSFCQALASAMEQPRRLRAMALEARASSLRFSAQNFAAAVERVYLEYTHPEVFRTERPA